MLGIFHIYIWEGDFMFIWIWQLQKQVDKYGGIENLIKKMTSLGVKDVCIKFHEGSSPIGGGVNFRLNFMKYKEHLKRAGFKVGTWGYNYFNNVTAEANLIIEALNNSDYYVFDPEVDVVGKTKEAEQVCKIVRAAHAKATIGYSSFPIVSYHTDIPYAVFNKYCDFASPQIYWGEMRWDVRKCINKMIEDYKAYGLNKPIYPSIQVYDCNSYSYEIFRNYEFPYSGAWSFDQLDDTATKFLRSYSPSTPNTPNIPNIPNIRNIPKPLKDTSIEELQRQLNSLINANLKVDGLYGPLTTAAVKVFQRLVGISIDGKAGIIVWGALDQIKAKPLVKISSSYRYAVRWIQKRVGTNVDGIYGKLTEEKVKQWQRWCNEKYNENLVVSGIVDIKTWTCMFKY
jgi:peptidoglycan hydrolase-like protein with peptidoglycan-binding domain